MATNNRFTITFEDGSTQEIFMSYGLLNQLLSYINDPSALPLLVFDPDMRVALISELLGERDKSGTITHEYNEFEKPTSPEAMSDLLAWALEHVTDFFIRHLETSQKALERVEEKSQKPGKTGSTA